MRCSLLLLVLPAVAAAQQPTVVKSKGPGAWGPTTRLVEELRIGELEGSEEYTLGQIVQLVVGKDGAIFAAEANPSAVRMYNASGKFVRKVGGVGSGPGEFRNVAALAVMHDGSIVVRDGNLGRTNIHDAQGNYVRGHTFLTGYFTADMFRVDPAGNFFLKARAKPFVPGTNRDQSTVWVKVNNKGEVLDSIPIPSAEPEIKVYGGPHKSDVDAIASTLSRDGQIISGDPQTYAFEIERPGQPCIRVEREYTPIRLTGAEKREWDAMAAWLSKQPGSQTFSTGPDGKRQVVNGPADKYIVPAVKPAYRTLRVDQDGRVWVERYVAATKQPPPPAPAPRPNGQPIPGLADRPVSVMREPITFDVFEADGRFLGTVVQPPKVRFMFMRGRNVWGVARGEFDESYIVRYRIDR